jgi:uncharacterized protein (DUF302 family)
MTASHKDQTPLAVNGLITKSSPYSVDVTLDRLEAALKERGYIIFARLDHAGAAASVGLNMPRSTVLIFGNPRVGTPNFIRNPSLAIDLPLKALVYQDVGANVWLSYNSAKYLFETIYARHGLHVDTDAMGRMESTYDAIANAALK